MDDGTYKKVVQGKCPLHFLHFSGAVCSNTLFSNASSLTNSLLFRANSTCKVLEHLVWSNTSGFQFWGPLARTYFLSALCGLPKGHQDQKVHGLEGVERLTPPRFSFRALCVCVSEEGEIRQTCAKSNLPKMGRQMPKAFKGPKCKEGVIVQQKVCKLIKHRLKGIKGTKTKDKKRNRSETGQTAATLIKFPGEGTFFCQALLVLVLAVPKSGPTPVR